MSISDLLEKLPNTDFDRRKSSKRTGTAGTGIAVTTLPGEGVEKLSAE